MHHGPIDFFVIAEDGLRGDKKADHACPSIETFVERLPSHTVDVDGYIDSRSRLMNRCNATAT